MSLPRRFWHEMTTGDFRGGDVARWIAVLPVAAIESHGPHLPLATDAVIAEGMIARALELMPAELPVTALPLQAVGKSDEHSSFPGTLTLGRTALLDLLLGLGESVHRAGLTKLVIVNSHGGNGPLLDLAIEELRARFGMLAVTTNWARFGLPEGLFTNEEATYGVHGGAVETSLMLALRPDLVRMDAARDFPSAQREFARDFKHLRAYGPARFGWRIEDLNPDGALGDAGSASAARGRAVIEHQAARFVELCEDIHRFDIGRLSST